MPLDSSKNQGTNVAGGGGQCLETALCLPPGALLLEAQHHGQLTTPSYDLGLRQPLLSFGLSLAITSS